MKVGDRVRLVQMPPGPVEGELRTKTIIGRCLGKVFPIAGFQKVVGFQKELLELKVGKVVGKASDLEKIWIEPEYVELVLSHKKRYRK